MLLGYIKFYTTLNVKICTFIVPSWLGFGQDAFGVSNFSFFLATFNVIYAYSKEEVKLWLGYFWPI